MGLFDKLKSKLTRTRENLSGRMDELVETYVELDDDFYDELTDILIMADVGMKTTELAVSKLREKCQSEKIGNPAKARDALKQILVDKKTGVNYLFVQSGYAGGLTVLLNADGKPVVTPIPQYEE